MPKKMLERLREDPWVGSLYLFPKQYLQKEACDDYFDYQNKSTIFNNSYQFV